MSKGGGGGGAQESTVVQTNLPEYAQPFYEELLGRTVYESTRPYEAYPGQRVAEFTDFENRGMQGMSDIAAAGTPYQTTMASDIADSVGSQQVGAGADIAAGFNPQNQFSEYNAGTIGSGYNAGDLGQGYQAGQRGVGYQPTQFTSGYDAGTLNQDFQAQDLTSGYQAGSFDPGYMARELGQDYSARDLQSGFQAGTIADADTLAKYTNPYQQLVTDIEKREAQKQSDIRGSELSQQAAQSGGLGGYREAIMQAERESDLGQQMADIQTRGGQAAFEQAQKAFEADRAARGQEETFRQSAFGTTEQARQAQQKMAIDSFQAGENARQQAASMGLTAQQQADAARQAQEKFSQSAFATTQQGRIQQQDFQNQAFQIQEQARQRAAEMGMNAQQQQDAANQAAERFAQSQFGQNEQNRLAQQQEQRAVFQASEAARQEAARLGLNAQEMQERVNQAQNDARMRARQENIGLAETRARMGFAGLDADRAIQGQRLDSARLLGQLGTDDQRMAFERMQNLQAAGQNQRDLSQRGMDLGYQDFLRQQAFGREQLGFFNNMLQGLPVTAGSQSTTFGGPSNAQQMLGAGLGGVGLYRAMS